MFFLLLILIISIYSEILSTQSATSSVANYQLYLCAQYGQLQNDLAHVGDYYKKLFANKAPEYIYPGYISHLFQSRNYKSIISLLPTLSSDIQKRTDMMLLLAQSYEHDGQEKKSSQLFKQLYEKNPSSIEFSYYAAAAYVRDKETTKALELIESYLSANPTSHKNFIFYFLKAQILVNLNKKDEALKSLKECISLMPTFEQGWLLYGAINELSQNIEGAIEGYQQYLQLVGSNKMVELQLAALMTKSQKNSPIENEALYYFQHKNYEKAMEMVEKELKRSPNALSYQILKIEILCATKKETEALLTIKQWILESPSNEQLYKLVHLLYFAGLEINTITVMLQDLEKKIPDYSFATLYLADLYLRTKKYENALDSLKKLLKKSLPDEIKTKTLYQCSLIHYQNNDWKALKSCLEQAYSLDKTFDPILNLLAYYYATKEKNYNKAQELISQALIYQPNNPHYLDTQGMIWYKKEEYEKAQLIFLKATQLFPRDPYILKHLGKALYKTGNILEAKNAFDRAHLITINQKKKKSVQEWLQRVNQTLLYSAK